MLKSTRREFLRWSLLGAASLVIAACAPAPTATPAPKPTEKPQEQPKAEPTKPPEAPTAAAQKVKIVYQARHGGTAFTSSAAYGAELWKQFFAYFNDKHPNIEVEWLPNPGIDLVEHLQSQFVAGNGPDVYQLCCWPMTHFIQQGQALNLQPYIDRDADEVKMDDFYVHQFKPWKKDGDIYAMPYYTGTVLVWYNKDIFDQEGLPYPPKKWGEFTFDQYRELAAKFVRRTEPLRWGTTNYCLAAGGCSWLVQYWLRGFGVHMVDPDDPNSSQLCDPRALECLEIMRKMIFEEKSFAQGAEVAGMDVHALFNGQRVAMLEIGTWAIINHVEGTCNKEGSEFKEFKWDCAPMWKGPGGITTHQSVDGQQCWSRTKHPEEAWQLCKEVASPKFEELNIIVGEGLQPSRKSVLPIYVSELRKKWPVLTQVNLELVSEAMAQNLGEPEEMFNNDKVCKDQILAPAFDLVLRENKAPVQLICEHSKLIPRFNRGEITIEQLGGEMAKIKV